MKIKKASTSGTKVESKGFVLFGTRPDNGKWFERWYKTFEKAESFAVKRSWGIDTA